MPLDHAEFIERQQKQEQSDQQALPPRLKNLIISAVFTVVYISGCIALAIMLEIDKTTAVLAGLLFIITSILVFWA